MGAIRMKYFIISVLLLLATVIVFAWTGITSGSNLAVPLTPEESAIVRRTAETTKVTGAETVWEDHLSAHRVSLSDFVKSYFTGTAYLLQGKDDTGFAEDLSYAIYGDNKKADTIAASLGGDSRIYTIEKSLFDLNPAYAPGFSPNADNKGTRVLAVTLENPIHDDENLAFGIRRSGGTISISGENARTDFYIDGNLRPGQLNLSADQGSSERFSLLWDTRREKPGNHSVQALLRTSDGRGTILTGGDVYLPEFFTLINDGVQKGSLPQGKKDVWYEIDAADRNAYVNFVDSSGDIKVTLYNLYGEKIGTNDLPGTSTEALRGKKQELLPDNFSDPYLDPCTNTFYVRVEPGGVSVAAPEITYLMVQSKNVARDNDGNYYAVVSDTAAVPTPFPTSAPSEDASSDTVDLLDFNNNPVTLKRSEIEILPINGCLYSLSVADTENRSLSLYPRFAPEQQAYAYVPSSDLSQIRIDAIASEGYAATVSVVSDVAEASETNGSFTVPILPSRNVIRVRITDFDGEVHEYPIFLLSGADTVEGYDTNTLNLFPESYRNGIWLLHNLKPSYQFFPYATGISWQDLMEGEDIKDRSLVSDQYSAGWVKDGSPVYDGSSWRAAKTEVVSYFLDPRNFLDPVYIFQFEKLSFDANVHTIEGIRNIVKNSFLEKSDPDYADILLKAGQNAGISPYFLASRILQEMGRNGESMLASGTLPGYEGYYNFYNIGSTPNPEVENGALINGAKYAMWGSDPELKSLTPEETAILLPWDSPEKAITGGAVWIAQSYVDIGQNTLYFQKFDVIQNEDGLFKHQYAQNIQMPYSESARYYRAYLSQEMIGEPFVFVLPIYDNMPTEYGRIPEE